MPRPRFFMSTTTLLCVTAALACSDSNAPGALPECTGAVTPKVGSGTTPRISWTPACRLFLVLVEDPSGGGDQWGVLSDSSNAIATPVTYGSMPAGATKELQAAIALTVGQQYHLVLYRFTGPGHEDGTLAGEADFTP